MVTKRKSVKNAKKISTPPAAAKAASEGSVKAVPKSPTKGSSKNSAKGAAKEPVEGSAKAASADAAKSPAKSPAESLAKGSAIGSVEGAAKAGGAKSKPSVASARTVAIPPSPAPATASASTAARPKKAAKQKVAPGQSGRLKKQAGTAAAAGEDGESLPSREGAPRKRADGRGRWPWYVALGVLAVLLVAATGFSWDRWLRYDDARELQGEWQVDGTTRVIVVDGASIKLTDDVAYAYTIDPTAKTIEFTFGNMEGSGRYRFSADRTQLVVMEGSSYSALSTLFEDIGWMWDGLVRSVQGKAPAQPEAGEGITVLARVSHDAAAQPRNDEGLAAGAAGAGSAADGASGAGSNANGSAGDADTNEGDSADAGGTGADTPVGDAGSGGDAGNGTNADGGNAAASGNTNGADASNSNASPSGGSGSSSSASDNLFDLDDVNDAGA